MKDFELIQGCISRDKQSWDSFVERFTRLIYDSILKTLKRYAWPADQQILDELHNDVFVYLLDNDCKILRAFRGDNGCELPHYIRTITVRKTVDYLRKQKRVYSIDERILTPEMVERALERQEDIETVDMLLAELKDDDRRLCRMFFKEGRRPEDIASQLGISVDNFYVRKQRVLRKLKQIAVSKKII